MPSCRPASASMIAAAAIRIGLRRALSRSPILQRLHRPFHRRLALQGVGLGGGGLRRAPRGGDEIRFRGVAFAGLCRLAALVAHALHDGIEVGRAGAGLQRAVGHFRIERLVEIDTRNVAARRRAGQRRNVRRLLALEGACQPAEHRFAACRLVLLGDGVGAERGHGGGRGGFRRRARAQVATRTRVATRTGSLRIMAAARPSRSAMSPVSGIGSSISRDGASTAILAVRARRLPTASSGACPEARSPPRTVRWFPANPACRRS